MADYTYRVFDPKIDNIYAAHMTGATIKTIGQREKADFACNFNYADDDIGVPIGRLIVGGKIVINDIPKTEPRDELYALPDGSLHIGKAPAGALWAVQGSPRLIDNGVDVIEDSVKRDKTGSDIYTRAAIRTAVGLTAARKLVIVRTHKAYTLKELGAIMKKLGCVEALNGDGGGSSYLYPDDSGFARKLGAALVVKKGVEKQMVFVVLGSGGHGAGTPGKETPVIKSLGRRIKEHEFNQPVYNLLMAELKRCGVFVHDDSIGDYDTPLADRVKFANQTYYSYCSKYGTANVKAVYVSIHFNASDGTFEGANPSGFSVHIVPGKRQAEAGRLAECVINELKAGTKQISRGIVEQNLYVTANTVMPAILSENGFMDNPEEAELMLNPAFQKEVAIEHAKGICKYFGIPYIAYPVKEVKPVDKPKTDYAGHWAESAIQAVIDSGIMVGDPKGNFNPDKPLTRAEMAVIIGRLRKVGD